MEQIRCKSACRSFIWKFLLAILNERCLLSKIVLKDFQIQAWGSVVSCAFEVTF